MTRLRFIENWPSREEVSRMNAKDLVFYWLKYQLPFALMGGVVGCLITRFAIIPLL